MRLSPVLGSQKLRYAAFLSSALLSGAALLSIQRGLAQSAPTCDPPGANEYLLLVTDQQADTEAQLRQLLPENAAITTCQYLEDQVVRVGGFANAEIADAWAKYVTDTTGLSAVVARPSAETATATPATPAPSASPTDSTAAGATNFPTPTQVPAAEAASTPAPSPSAPAQSNTAELPSLNQAPTPSVVPSPATPTPAPEPNASPSTPAPAATTPAATTAQPNPAFAPKPLGSGYAVLVNYANRPEVAADVRQVTSQPVGLVSYNQRPFLLAAHTTDPAAATAVLQSLNDRGFNAVIIDSRNAILLTPAVVGTGG